MASRDYLGEFEQIVLIALVRLGRDAYGMNVRREIEERTGRDVSIGAVYTTLDRLEEKGYVTSSLSDPTPVRGGRSKRFFRLTASGTMALEASAHALQQMWKGVGRRWSTA